MSDPQQQQMIQDAMKAIAQRRPGRTKLVYDKTERTIVAVAEGAQSARALNITADDADMFAVVTLSSRWLSDRWPLISRDRAIPIRLSSWDDGDALTQYDLGVQPSPSDIEGMVILGEGTSPPDGIQLNIVRTDDVPAADPSRFVAPNGEVHRALGWRHINGHAAQIEVAFVDVQPALASRRAGILETT